MANACPRICLPNPSVALYDGTPLDPEVCERLGSTGCSVSPNGRHIHWADDGILQHGIVHQAMLDLAGVHDVPLGVLTVGTSMRDLAVAPSVVVVGTTSQLKAVVRVQRQISYDWKYPMKQTPKLEERARRANAIVKRWVETALVQAGHALSCFMITAGMSHAYCKFARTRPRHRFGEWLYPGFPACQEPAMLFVMLDDEDKNREEEELQSGVLHGLFGGADV